MPTLPAPYPFLPSGGDLPVSTTDDTLAAHPARVREVEVAPVRDAIVEAQTTMFLSHQERASFAAAQSDPTRATGQYLHGLGEDRGIFAQEDEETEPYRGRIFATAEVVTPGAIVGAVNAILAPYTTKEAQLFEPAVDRMFLRNDSTSWGAFLTDGLTNIDPEYVDRRYALRPNSHPGGAWAFGNGYGRYFVLRVPQISNTGSAGFVFTTNKDAVANNLGLFLGDGTDPDGSAAGFLYEGLSGAINVYQAIVNTVERLRGHGVRWMLIVDPKL